MRYKINIYSVNFFMILSWFISPICLAAYPCFPKNMTPYQLQSNKFDIKAPSDGTSPTTDVAKWDLGNRMEIYCTGGTPNTTSNKPVFYKFSPMIAGEMKNGPLGREYIIINEYVALAFDIWLGGGVNDYIKLDSNAKWLSNEYFVTRKFDSKGVLTISDTQTGNKGKVYLWIMKPFVGKKKINPTKVLNVIASFDNIDESSKPYMDLTVMGEITSNATCEFTEQVYIIEYGELTPSNITSLSKLDNNQLGKALTLNLNCSQNISKLPMTISLVGASTTTEGKAFSTSHPDIGIAVKANEKLVHPLRDMASIPNADQQIETKTNGTQKSATIQAYPVKLDGKVSPGEFKATATLKVDFK
ncbi:fimbrial protein [Aeromonas salmonicida]|uniref:fimbrial protein n=1 Tax=Aeromonas salmonicida TaxID=645 RepID=UPI003D310B87